MRIQHNILAMNAYRNYNTNTSALAKNLEKLSSGYKINRAGDDAAGLAISEKMRAQIQGLNAASKNVKDGTSLVKTAEGAMQEIQDMLGRMKYLATQSANGTYDNEVDRKALQDEVEQLKSEINRIADSANFNGIKLLDGSMGLNGDAFSISGAPAADATGGTIDGTQLAVNDAKLHTEKSGVATQTPPALTIDLGSLAFDAGGGDTTVKIDVFGKDISLALEDDGGTTNDGKYTASDIATALKTALQSDALGVDPTTGLHDSGDTTKNTGIKLGDFVFNVGGTGSEITLTYAGLQTGTTAADFEATGEFTTTQADAINTLIGQGVSVSDAGTAVKTGDVIHDTTKVNYAQAKTPSSMAGVDIDLSKIIGQGNTLTIDGQTYIFQTEAGKTPTGTGTVIDVSAGKDLTEQIHMAVDELSKQAAITGQTDGAANGRTWKISSAGNTKIHIDQTAATTDKTKALDTYDKIASVISATTPTVAAKNIGTNIKITDGSVVEGDVLTIDGESYTFSDKNAPGASADGSTTYVAIKGGAAQNLADAITGSEFDAATNTVTVRAADKDATFGPSVLGKGLQLQIGDTSDSYNQMAVRVNDMHTEALGIDKLDISNPESASGAIQTVMNAINSVSSTRGLLGATQNRLDHTANNLSVMIENIQDAESTIRDTDVAEEMMAYTKNNILVQSAQAMLAQANAVPQGVLQLLG